MKRILSLLLLLLLCRCGFGQEAPTLQCLQLRNQNTRLFVAWSNSQDCESFDKYYIYVNNALMDSIAPSSGYSLCNYGGKVINNIPASNSYSCQIRARDAGGGIHISNTIQTISLTVTPNEDSSMAYLSWESPSSGALSGNWGGIFSIYKKHEYESDFSTTPFATVTNTQFTYTDTADVCYSENSYQVGIVNYYSELENCIFKTTIGTVMLVDRVAPLAPILDSVSYTADNHVALGFHAPEEQMAGYILYFRNGNGQWETIDTIFNTTYWVDPNGGERCYRIAVLDSCFNSSPMVSDEQCDMQLYLQGTDACHHTVSLSWNTYTNLYGEVEQYEVFLSSDGGDTWQSAGTTTSHSITVSDIDINVPYIAFVRVYNNGRTITASSNRINFSINAEEAADFTYIRSVSVEDSQQLTIRVITSGDTLPFSHITLQRSTNGVDFVDIQTQLYQGAEYSFIDPDVDVAHNLYYYRTYVLNNCNMAGGHSNIAHNILLNGEATSAQSNNLQWNNYDGWAGENSHFMLYRKLESDSVFVLIDASIMPSILNTYSDDVSQLYESGARFEYYVEAQENPNTYGFSAFSRSNTVSLLQSPNTYIPNAFAPLSATNNIFLPRNSFVSPENYTFTIYSRWGDKVFSTRDPYKGWDGYFDGHVAPMDVYMYRITYTLPSGERHVQTGSVTLVH